MATVISVFLVICHYFLVGIYADSCYSNVCRNNATNPIPTCITKTSDGDKCANLNFYNLGHIPPAGISLTNFKLSAYVDVFPDDHISITAFNFTVKDTSFKHLITRYQRIGYTEINHCRLVELFDSLHEFYDSCLFYPNSSYEGDDYRLEYSIAGGDYEFSRKLVFRVPPHLTIDDDVVNIKRHSPFFYVDVSDTNTLTLYIQPLSEKLNISKYKVWMINDDGPMFTVDFMVSNRNEHLQYNFSVSQGLYHFIVTAIHDHCGEYGCLNSTSPPISTKQPSRRLLIMIISVVWIPLVVIYAMYYIYKLLRSQELVKRIDRKPNCLLVYSPTHTAHVNVMTNLAKFLRSYNINAMIDVLDISETDAKDPGLWCNMAFQTADVIALATSPPPTDSIVPVIYQNIDNHALRLIKENYSRRNKKYIVLELPYCKPDDVPEEAHFFKRLIMPENLNKFVRFIHNVNYLRFYGVSSKEFIDSINIATMEIPQERPASPKSAHETDDLLPLTKPVLTKVHQENLCQAEKLSEVNSKNFENPRSFATNISELNLLGAKLESDEESIKYMSPVPDSQFRIDQLNL